MAEPAIGRMTVDEFLSWDDGTDTRYELVDGVIVAMAPAARTHGALSGRLVSAIDAALAARPECVVYVEAGILPPDQSASFYVPDVSVSCTEPDDDVPYLRNSVLIVEILSPSTAAFDRNTKISGYQAIPSVEEILLLDSRRIFAEVLRRDGDRWVSEIAELPEAILHLRSIPLSIAMAALYRGVRLPTRMAGDGE